MNRTRLAVTLPLAGLLAAAACAGEAEDATLDGTTVEARDTGAAAGMVTGTTGAPGPGTAGTPGTPPAPVPDTIQ